jgi:hypothetical protein
MLTDKQQNLVDNQVRYFMVNRNLPWDNAVYAVACQCWNLDDNAVAGFYMEQKALWEVRKAEHDEQLRAEHVYTFRTTGM